MSLEPQIAVERPHEVRRERVLSPYFLVTTVANFGYFLTIGMLIPILPRFVEGPLDGGGVDIGFVIGAFSLAAVLTYITIGRVADRVPRRVLMGFGGGIVGASVAGFALQGSLAWLLALRFLSGIGGASFYVGAASTINDLAPEERRGEALSYFSVALYGGLALGPVIGELLLGNANFELVWIVAAVSSLAAGALGSFVPDTRTTVIDAPTRHLFHRAALIPGAVLATSVWGLAGFNTFVPLYALDIGMSGSRLVFVLYAAIVLGFRSLGARIPDRLGARVTATTALGCSFLGLITIGVWSTVAGLFVGTAVFAVGQALAFPALMTIAVRGAPPSERAAVVATFVTFFDAAFGLAALSLGGVAEATGYGGVFLGAGVVAGIGVAGLAGRGRARA